MLESQKVARYSTDFSSKTREKNFILNSHSPFFPRVSSPRIGRPSPFHCSPCRANYYAPSPTNFLFFSTRHNGKSIYRFWNSGFNRFKRRRLVFLASARPDVSALLPFFRVKTARNYRLVSIVFLLARFQLTDEEEERKRRRRETYKYKW